MRTESGPVYSARMASGRLSASYDGSLILWNLEAGKPIKTLKGHEFGVTSCAFSRDGNLVPLRLS